LLGRKMNWHDDNGVAWLLDHGADANYAGHWGTRPLHDALAHGTPLHYFERLLDHGANPALTTKDGVSSFAAAARLGRADVLDLFEQRGFSVALEGDDAFLATCARADEATARRIANADPEIVHRIQSRNPTLLIDFAGSAHAKAVRLLLDLGFDLAVARTEPPWSRGLTALHEATGHCRLETVELLIARGARSPQHTSGPAVRHSTSRSSRSPRNRSSRRTATWFRSLERFWSRARRLTKLA
jgi:ankyrin repeat protein